MAADRRGSVIPASRRKRWGMAEGREVVEAWRQSGERLGEFARRHGLKPQRLSRWLQRVERGAEPPVRFHPVQLVERRDSAGTAEPIEIVLPEGVRVRVPTGFAGSDLERVLSVLATEFGC